MIRKKTVGDLKLGDSLYFVSNDNISTVEVRSLEIVHEGVRINGRHYAQNTDTTIGNYCLTLKQATSVFRVKVLRDISRIFEDIKRYIEDIKTLRKDHHLLLNDDKIEKLEKEYLNIK